MKRVATVLLCALVLAGCADTRESTESNGTGFNGTGFNDTGFNDTDVMFLQMMGPHHTQGLEMVRLVAGRATRAEVKTLAAAIEATQANEVRTMADWLRAWRQPLTADPRAHEAHGGAPETSPAEIAMLERATGADFERRFLNTMIAHQDDAIQVARMETSAGRNARVKEFADRIDKSRSAQITQMLALLPP